MTISRDSRWLALGTSSSIVRVYDLHTKSPPESVRTVNALDTGWARVLLITPDGRWLFVWSENNLLIRGWNLPGGELSTPGRILQGHSDGVVSLSCSRDSRWLASGSDDGTVRIWDLADDQVDSASSVLRAHDAAVRAEIGLNGQRIATACNDGTARWWDLGARSPESAPLVLYGGDKGTYSECAISSNSRWIANSLANGGVRVWDLAARDLSRFSRVLPWKGQRARLEISPDSRWLIAGSRVGPACMWDLRSTDPLSSAVLLGKANADPAVGMDNFTIDDRSKESLGGHRWQRRGSAFVGSGGTGVFTH